MVGGEVVVPYTFVHIDRGLDQELRIAARRLERVKTLVIQLRIPVTGTINNSNDIRALTKFTSTAFAPRIP